MPRRHVIVVSSSEPRGRASCNVTTTPAAIAQRLRLAMNGGSIRFVRLFERSAPWPLAR
jgi:hypothetical protein